MLLPRHPPPSLIRCEEISKEKSKKFTQYSWRSKPDHVDRGKTAASHVSTNRSQTLNGSTQNVPNRLSPLSPYPGVHTSLGQVEHTRLKSVPWGRQHLIGTLTSGPILVLSAKGEVNGKQASGNMLLGRLDSRETQPMRWSNTRSTRLQSTSTNRSPLSLPLPVVREHYIKVQKNLASEVAVLRSSLELHNLTTECGHQLQQRWGQNRSSQITSSQISSVSSTTANSTNHSWQPGVQNAKYRGSLPGPSSGNTPGSISPEPSARSISPPMVTSMPVKANTSSMLRVIQKEIEKVDALRCTSTSPVHFHADMHIESLQDGENEADKPAKLDDVVERLTTMSYASAGSEEPSGSSQVFNKSWPCLHCGIWVERDLKSSNDRHEQCCGGSEVPSNCYCCMCIAHLGEGAAWCKHCNRRWKRLKQLELSLGEYGSDARLSASQFDEFFDCTSATRALVGPAWQHRLDLITVNVLLQHSEGIKYLFTMIREGGLRCECADDRGTVAVLTAEGKLNLSVNSLECQAAMEEGERPAQGSRRTIPHHLRLRSVASGLSLLDGSLTSIDVSGNMLLSLLPLQEVVAMQSLRALECSRCPCLRNPSPSICAQGGSFVLSFLRRSSNDWISLMNMDLIAMGNRKTGKTCIIKALAGNNLTTWDVSHNTTGLSFNIKELTSQRAKNVLINQFLFVRRAIYLLVWHVEKRTCSAGKIHISDMISTWLDSLHLSVPDAHVILVVTHVDTTPRDEVDKQVRFAHQLVQIKIHETQAENVDGSVLPLAVWNGGESVRFNCLNGDGTEELKEAIISMAQAVPWSKELLPESYGKLHNEIKAEGNFTQRKWLTWNQYAEVAERCGLVGEQLDIATMFLHNTSFIQYFGSATGRNELDCKLIDSTVFIDRFCIHDIFQGLLFPGRDSLSNFFANAKMEPDLKYTWLRHVHRLAAQGILHEELVPFLWPGGTTPLSKEYWKEPRDLGFFFNNCFLSQEDYNVVLLMLESRFVIFKSSDVIFVVPILLAKSHFNRIDARAFSRSDCRISTRIVLTTLAPTFFQELVVIIRKKYMHTDYNNRAACFYRRGVKAQLFLSDERTKVCGRLRTVKCITCLTCTAGQADEIEELVNELLLHFPGSKVMKVHCNVERRRAMESPVQVRILCSPLSISIEFATHIKRTLQEVEVRYEQKPIRVDIAFPGVLEMDSHNVRVFLIVVDPWVGRDEKGRRQIIDALGRKGEVIPLICPGYDMKDYVTWWPEYLPELKPNILFFDCRNMLSDSFKVFADSQDPQIANNRDLIENKYMGLSIEEKGKLEAIASEERNRWLNTVQPHLIGRISKALEDWRGEVPELMDGSKAFSPAKDIICCQCVRDACRDPCMFSTELCLSRLHDWQAKQNSIRCQVQQGGADLFGMTSEYTEVCSNRHQVQIQSLLARSTNYDAVSCPTCVQIGEVPPFCFSQEQVRNLSRMSLECPTCAAGGRKSCFNIQDIISPHVYISYNEGVPEVVGTKGVMSTEELVKSFQTTISEQCDLICWFERERVTFGLQRSDEGEPETSRAQLHPGVFKSPVIILFLSDAFCASELCVREYLYAARNGRHIIPVLVPNKGPVCMNGPSSGWTGSGGEDSNWWCHAASCSACRDPDTNKTFSWSALSLFEPIDLRFPDKAPDTEQLRVAEQAAHFQIGQILTSSFFWSSHSDEESQERYNIWRKMSILERLNSFSDRTSINWDAVREDALVMFNSLDTNSDNLISEEELAFWGVRGGIPGDVDELAKWESTRSSLMSEEAPDGVPDFPVLDSATTKALMAASDVDEDGLINFDDLWSVLLESVL